MIGLALEGGGAKGSYQAGAYLALKKCHVKIQAVSGTSIGSLNGALIASHEEKKMLELWRDTSMRELLGIDENKAMDIVKNGFNLDNIKWTFSEIYKMFKNKGLDISPYRALVRNNVNEKKLRLSNIKYGLTTIKLDTKEPMDVYLEDIPKGKLHDYIVASSYLPIFKKEKLIDDSYYLDGGFFNICPIDMLEKMGCNKIYSINIKGIGIRKKNNSNVEVIEIKPKSNLGSVLFFDKDSIEENIKYGYYDTLRVLNRIDGYEYYFKKKWFWYYKRLNHKIDKNLYKSVETILKTYDEKSTVIKALEYVLKKEALNDLKIYKQRDIIKKVRKIKSDNFVYKYVSELSFW